MRILAMDIGNTRASLGLFEGRVFLCRRDIPTEALCADVLDALSDRPDICVVSCVSQQASFVLNALRREAGCPVIEVRSSEAPIKIHYSNVACLGQDRIANALGASLHSESGAIVIDMGTATHFDVIDPAGEFWGGPILMGLETMTQALVQRIPHLPRVALNDVVEPLSQSTESAIRTGTLLSAAGGIERIVYEIRKQLDYSPKTILTGGSASLIEPYIAYDEWIPGLTLEGICEYGIRYQAHIRRISA